MEGIMIYVSSHLKSNLKRWPTILPRALAPPRQGYVSTEEVRLPAAQRRVPPVKALEGS